ncbi:hypothetical protein FA95DRAFT_1507029, partial [Auriscalpium vulgare]
NLRVPVGRYYVADAGFPNCDALLVPYRGVRYHLREWQEVANRYCCEQLLFIAVCSCISIGQKTPRNSSICVILSFAMSLSASLA